MVPRQAPLVMFLQNTNSGNTVLSPSLTDPTTEHNSYSLSMLTRENLALSPQMSSSTVKESLVVSSGNRGASPTATHRRCRELHRSILLVPEGIAHKAKDDATTSAT